MKFVPCALIIALTLGGCSFFLPASSGPGDTAPLETAPRETDTSGKTTPVQTGVMLFPEGIGTFEFGAPEADVLQYLAEALGDDYLTEGGPGVCGGAAGYYQMYAYFGEELKVRFSSDDEAPEAPESPRYLQSWEFISEDPPAPPLILSAQIKWDITLEELMDQYPDGGGVWDSMGAWFMDDVAIFPPSAETSATVLYAGTVDWCS